METWRHSRGSGQDDGIESFVDEVTTRGVYYYEVFAKDGAGKYSATATTNSRATNYWLGDVTGDGYVNIADWGEFASSYNKSDGDDDYNNECDFGPTDDATSYGIPETDDDVDTVDNAIFGANYNNVAPLLPPSQGSLVAYFSWVQVSENCWQLELVKPCKALKLVRAFHSEESFAPTGVRAGALLKDQERPYLMHQVDSSVLDVSAVITGPGNCYHGSGVLFEVESQGGAKLQRPELELIGPDFKVVEYEWVDSSSSQQPTLKLSASSYPNPFNPITTIEFSVPETGHVEVAIFNVNGRKIAQLVNEHMSAGWHSTTWKGRTESGEATASGVYWYRVSTAGQDVSKKIVLLK